MLPTAKMTPFQILLKSLPPKCLPNIWKLGFASYFGIHPETIFQTCRKVQPAGPLVGKTKAYSIYQFDFCALENAAYQLHGNASV